MYIELPVLPVGEPGVREDQGDEDVDRALMAHPEAEGNAAAGNGVEGLDEHDAQRATILWL